MQSTKNDPTGRRAHRENEKKSLIVTHLTHPRRGRYRSLAMIPLPELKLLSKPFPHVAHEGFLPTDVYKELCRTFPECPTQDSPTGYSLFWGNEPYEKLMATNAAWKSLFDTVQSQEFVDYAIRQFGDACREGGCLVDLSKAKYVSYQESVEDKNSPQIKKVTLAPEELFVRMDILQGQLGYYRSTHVDWRRRLITFLVYFCSADENGIDGGDLVLRGSGIGQKVIVRPSLNLMAGFPCTNNSLHSVSRMKKLTTPRNYIQIHVSSSVDAWPKMGPIDATSLKVRANLDRIREVSFAKA